MKIKMNMRRKKVPTRNLIFKLTSPDTNTKVTTDVSKKPKSGEASDLAPKEPRWYHPNSVGIVFSFLSSP